MRSEQLSSRPSPDHLHKTPRHGLKVLAAASIPPRMVSYHRRNRRSLTSLSQGIDPSHLSSLALAQCSILISNSTLSPLFPVPTG